MSRVEDLRAQLVMERPALRRIICAQPLPRFFSHDESRGPGFRLWSLQEKFAERRRRFVSDSFRTPRDLYDAARWLERVDSYLDAKSIGIIFNGRRREGLPL